ncbi:hypothetical protein CkaCkLH20_05844 [Colletotrichum karsti]|uniref:Ubiquitin-like domain-containing protein n=1 Tax=Colletotrichum karsti TaxID=1095194 RepID=A0A9P6LKR1_9PEZI|nr:uncharacterized protein CkaCkLH20_05844 [Colletotrichum karsti]KAF9876436.1 hypothetical protein CkaCkLH20_05844 [Colletotrichum karsti]
MADAAKQKKRLPFKPTALRQKSAPKPAVKSDDEDNDDGSSLFNRGASVFEQEQEERRMKRKQTERERSIQEQSSVDEKKFSPRTSEDPFQGKSYHDRDVDTTPPSKRSRTSDESPESRIKSSPSKRAATETPSKRMTRAAHSRTPRKQEPVPLKPVISIDDSDDDEDDIYDASPVRKPIRETLERDPTPLVIDEDDDDPFEIDDPAAADDEDDDMAAYVRAAKEKAERKAREQSAEAKHTVIVFVHSEIPGVDPKQFRFPLTKPIRVLRKAWMDFHSRRINLTDTEISEVFLTWRGHKLYDLSTLDSLDLPGEYRKCKGQPEGFKDDDWKNVIMEIWTPALWEEHEKQLERQRRHDLGEFSEDEGGDDQAEVVEAEPEEKKIKVLLKTKTDEPLKTSVRPSTSIATIAELFRKMRGLPEDAPIRLMFDGDELDEDMTVADADIDDLDTIEVYLR